jgi:hypothetical protein
MRWVGTILPMTSTSGMRWAIISLTESCMSYASRKFSGISPHRGAYTNCECHRTDSIRCKSCFHRFDFCLPSNRPFFYVTLNIYSF